MGFNLGFKGLTLLVGVAQDRDKWCAVVKKRVCIIVLHKGEKFRVCKSVHHHTFNWINQPDAANSQVYHLSFKYSSTCFGHPYAHHQEQPLVYRRSLVIAVLLVVVGRTTTNRIATTTPQRQTRGCYCSFCSSWWWAWGCPQTCWAVHKRQIINLRICCIWLVDSVESQKFIDPRYGRMKKINIIWLMVIMISK